LHGGLVRMNGHNNRSVQARVVGDRCAEILRPVLQGQEACPSGEQVPRRTERSPEKGIRSATKKKRRRRNDNKMMMLWWCCCDKSSIIICNKEEG